MVHPIDASRLGRVLALPRARLVALVGVLAACGANEPPQPMPPVAAPAPPPPPVAPAAPDRTLRYTVLMMDHPAGASVVTVHADGSRDTTWSYSDRGRGPDQRTHYEVAADGTFVRVDIHGVDYLKQSVEEQFSITAGAPSWKSDSEHGSAPAGTAALYIPTQGPPELFAAEVRAILHAPSRAIALLPAGEARVAPVTPAEGRTFTAKGRSVHATRYEVTGFDYEPDVIWLDDDGELFAQGATWASIVREGWEEVVPQLVRLQRDAQSARLAALAQTLGHKPPAGLAIVHARLFDVETKKATPDATIVVKGDRIVAAGPSGQIKVPPGVELLDARGKTAIPGLWDMHEHASPIDGLLYLASGVTGARDLGNDMDEVLRIKRAWDTGTEIGPRLVLAGFIDGRGPFQAPTKVFADTVEEGRADIDAYVAHGFEQIKLYSSLKPELVPPLAAYAHGKGLRVSGHVPTGMTVTEAVNAGYDEVQHTNFLYLGFLATKDEDTRTPLRFTRVAEKGAGLDLGSAPVRDLVKLLATHKTVIDPTLGVFEGMLTARRGTVDPGYAVVADRVPVQVRRALLQGGLPVPEGMDATYRASFASMQKLVKRLWDAGVRIVPGTDGGTGFALMMELELYEQAGIPAADVLALATIGAARVMRHEKEWGSLRPGKYADLVLVDGQPDVHVSDARKAVVVVKGGVVYRTEELMRAAGIRP